MNSISVDFVRDLIEKEGKTTVQTLEKIVNSVRAAGFTNLKGFSLRSLERFMLKHGICRHINDIDLDNVVKQSVYQLGGFTGAKMTAGYLRSQFAMTIGRNRVSSSLRRVDPDAAVARHRTAHRLINPKIYYGRYFGYNLHMDQNEKLIMFGVTVVLAMDGFSGMVVGDAVMADKNNIIIYNEVYRRIVTKYGLWKRVIVDYGKEFFLTLYMHMWLHHEMGLVDDDNIESCYKQTKSTRNNRIERLWVGVNQQVLYPIKHCMADMVQNNTLDASEDYQMFSAGEIIRPLVRIGLKIWIEMWNNHIVPKRGRPLDYLPDSQTVSVAALLLVDGGEAADKYRHDGGSLTDQRDAPGDLLESFPEAREHRDHVFWEEEFPAMHQRILSNQLRGLPQLFIDTFRNRPFMELLFGATTNGTYWPLQEVIARHYTLSAEIYNALPNLT